MEESFSELKNKIKNKECLIGIIGLGYVGLTLARTILNKGFKVIGYDISLEKINLLKKGRSYIVDVKDGEIETFLNKTFFPTNSVSDLKDLDIFIVSVPTPLNEDESPELKFVLKAIRDIRKNLQDKNLIIFESTLPPGTTEEIIYPKLKKSGKNFYLCFSPERINPGSNYPVDEIPKIISGIDDDSLAIGTFFYSHIFLKVIPVSSTKTAEYIKLLENSFRFINISFINEFAKLTSMDNVDIFEVIEGAKTKPYGFVPFYPNWGVGGDCIPTVPLFLVERGKKLGFKFSSIEYSNIINKSMPYFWFEKIKKYLKKGKVFVIGVTYKRDVNDIRNSQPLKFIELLLNKGINVSYFDPFIEKIKVNNKILEREDIKKTKLKNFDLIVIGTNHSGIAYDILLEIKKPILDPYGVLPKTKYTISF
ncbi:MAG: nucleotide sugar dehydrogenase [Caldisericia bacterium]|jgi:UDP-N-acetyl-D-glucosamine dehydrogenase|nr:nucleotide sugar dehydrogenase [Caldisericia bacterium]